MFFEKPASETASTKPTPASAMNVAGMGRHQSMPPPKRIATDSNKRFSPAGGRRFNASPRRRFSSCVAWTSTPGMKNSLWLHE